MDINRIPFEITATRPFLWGSSYNPYCFFIKQRMNTLVNFHISKPALSGNSEAHGNSSLYPFFFQCFGVSYVAVYPFSKLGSRVIIVEHGSILVLI